VGCRGGGSVVKGQGCGDGRALFISLTGGARGVQPDALRSFDKCWDVHCAHRSSSGAGRVDVMAISAVRLTGGL
jgi:hypothetical protein